MSNNDIKLIPHIQGQPTYSNNIRLTNNNYGALEQTSLPAHNLASMQNEEELNKLLDDINFYNEIASQAEEENDAKNKKIFDFNIQMTDGYNNMNKEVVERTPITEDNKEDIKKYFNLTEQYDSKEFDELCEKYDAEVIITEDGREVLRFKDRITGKPIIDYNYGTKDDDNFARTKAKYTHYEDGSYRVDATDGVATWETTDEGEKIWKGWIDGGKGIPTGYYNADGSPVTSEFKKSAMKPELIAPIVRNPNIKEVLEENYIDR